MTTARGQLADEILRRFAAALRSGQLYSAGHPIIGRNVAALFDAVARLHALNPALVLGIIGEEIIVDDVPVSRGELHTLIRRLKQLSVERLTIERGVTNEELVALLEAVATLEAGPDGAQPDFPALPHIRVGRVTIDERVTDHAADMATFKRMYLDAVSVAENVWESALVEKKPDATQARAVVDGLAHAVSQNRTALLALTTLKKYDNYTFTHMVNVSILTMGQARALGIDGPILREFGLAALMHDLGKVRVPLDILNKPEALTPAEFDILKRHPVDGAAMLRATPDMPALVPVVAFEHHLRLDGTGYPAVTRNGLNLGTMLCSIADVYDAMRSQRLYQEAFPSDRILAVMKRNDGKQFDQHLVRRFVQLVGIYPAGSLVRLSTGEIAVVVTVNAPDPNRPHVRVVLDAAGVRKDPLIDLNLWESQPDGSTREIVAPVDPAEIDIDPLLLL